MFKKIAEKIDELFNNLTDLTAEDLLPNEEVLYSTRRVWYSEYVMIAMAFLLTCLSIIIFIYNNLGFVQGIWHNLLNIASITVFAAGIIMSTGLVLDHYSQRYFATNMRVIKRRGLFSKKIDYIPYDKIQNVKIHKNIGERIVDMGDIYIDTAGSSDTEIVITDIHDPEKLHNIILEQINKNTRK